MTHIHDNEVNNIAELNSLHDIINRPKRSKILNIHYSPILHGFMNTSVYSTEIYPQMRWLLLSIEVRFFCIFHVENTL